MRNATVILFIWGCANGATAFAQPPAPAKIWTVLASAGLAVTSGNTDTSTANVAYDVTYDPHMKNVVKSDGLLLRGKTEGVLSTNRLGINGRDEYHLSAKTFVFGQNQYLRDEFKRIDFLIAPTGGVGYKAFDTQRSKLSVDGGIGGVWEKGTGLTTADASGALTVGEKLVQTVTATTTATQGFNALWKTKDMGDAL